MGLGRKANQVFLTIPNLFYLAQMVNMVSILELLELYQVYIIDFGLAKRYRDSSTNRHIPYRYLLILIYVFLQASVVDYPHVPIFCLF